MSLLAEMKADHLEARKERSVAITKILVTVLGEMETVSKRTGDPITDAIVITKVKKTISNNMDIISLNVESADELVFENKFLSHYLPKQLCKDELKEILSEVLFNNIGEGMRYLKANYEGRFNGKDAKEVVLSILE